MPLACKNSQKSKEDKVVTFGSYQENVLGMVDIHTFDHYARRLNQGYGFYVADHVIVAPLSLIKGAYRVKIAPLGTTQMFDVAGYTAFDLTNNLVALRAQRKNQNYIDIKLEVPEEDTLYTLFRSSGRLMVRKSTTVASDSVAYLLKSALEVGKPAFFGNHALAGIVQCVDGDNCQQISVLKLASIQKLLKSQTAYPQPVIELSGKSDKVYTSYKEIAGFRFVTDMGNFTIRLFDETPLYRDNFIKLVEDQFYDSLLVHRVLANFLVQTGAADTRYATPEDVVGWQGPGYTLPMKVLPNIFHKRGAVAASKLPDARNPKNSSDGSQFYIVSGRIYTSHELDELETQKGIRFSSEQRRVYTTIGGAPHLDNDYTVFGEVWAGMDVVDRISGVETYQTDRPKKDIRIKRVETIRK